MGLLVANLIWCIIIALILSSCNLSYNRRCNLYSFFAFGGVLILRTFVDPQSLPDLETYLNIWEISTNLTWQQVLKGEGLVISEYGYLIINKLCTSVSKNYQLLFFFVSIIWIYSYHTFFKRYSPHYVVSVLLLLVTEFPQSLFVLRQHLAIGIWLFSFPYVINRDFKRFCMVGLLAFSMHMTSILFFPIYFLYGISDKRRIILVTLVMCAACVILFSSLGSINDRFGLSYENYIVGEKSGFSNLTDFTMRIIYLGSYVFFLKSRVMESGINRLVAVILIFSTALALFGTSFSLTGRLVRYFTPAIMIMVPIVMKNIRNKGLRYIYFIGILALNSMSIFAGSMSEWIRNFKLLF